MNLATAIRLRPGDILYREGDSNDCGYVIVSGEVILSRDLNGKRVFCERRGKGAVVGELSILRNQPRAVTVEAATDCQLLRISADQIEKRYNQLDPILRACIDTSITFSAHYNQKLEQVPFIHNQIEQLDLVIDRLKMESCIEEGLSRNEFSMVYQPIVRLEDNQIAGFEALMRWYHPSMGDVSPQKFILIAEEMGIVGKLTEFALTETCATLQRLRNRLDEARLLFVSVNISASDLGKKNFVDLLQHVLDRHGLDPSDIKLEITETALMPDTDYTELNLKALKNLGFGLSIDDFGTGYSNLGYLKTLPLSTLKIDREFASDACRDPISESIVRMLVALGNALGVDIVAEGLETIEDVNALRDLGCEYAQGYYFCHPLSEIGIEGLISRWARELGKPPAVAI